MKLSYPKRTRRATPSTDHVKPPRCAAGVSGPRCQATQDVTKQTPQRPDVKQLTVRLPTPQDHTKGGRHPGPDAKATQHANKPVSHALKAQRDPKPGQQRAARSLPTHPRSAGHHTHHNKRIQFGLGNFVSPSCINPKPGDLIELDRKLYSHWALYVGDGQVIHVSGESSDIATENVFVRQSSLHDVAGESLVRINNKTVPAKERKLRALDARRIVAHARRSLGRSVQYDMIRCNAEHHVTLWRYGKAWSDQAETAVAVMTPYKRRCASHTPVTPSSPSLDGVPPALRRKTPHTATGSLSSLSSCSSVSPASPAAGSPVPPLPSPGGVLSDKDVSFETSLLAGLAAIFAPERAVIGQRSASSCAEQDAQTADSAPEVILTEREK